MSIRPPRVRMITFHSCHCLIYCRRFVQYGTLLCFASSSVSIQPYMRFLFVSASVCVRLPSDSTSRWTPLSFANSSYCKACSGLSPPSYHPCRAHQINQTVPFRLSPVFLHPYYPEKDASQPGSSPRQFPQSHIQKDAGCRCRQDIRYRFRVIDSHHIKIVG